MQRASEASQTIGFAGIGLIAALIYLVIVGGSSGGELNPVLRVINAALAAAIMVVYVLRAPVRADRLDQIVLLGIALFAIAGVFSQFPRQSFDAALAGLAYGGGFFLARDHLAREPVQRTFVRVLVGLSAVFTIGAAMLWLPQVIEWWALVDGAATPPLDLPLSAGPWGHRYDVSLLITILYPAWWMDRPSTARRLVGVLVGLITVVVIVFTGSRTTWLAIATASVIIGLPVLMRLWRRYPQVRVPALMLSVMTVVGASLSGAATAFLERLLAFESLDWRLAMWGPLTGLWLNHPVAGVGPGGFPWALQLTPYFDARSWAPRHPDNALIQVVAEAGILGLAALLIVGAALLLAVFRGRSTAARWVAIVIVVTTLGSNPTDFPFLVAIGIAWAAYASPRSTDPHEILEPPTPSRLRRGLTLTVLGVAAALHASTLAAGFAYEHARAAASDGDFAGAEEALSLAIHLDPGMALYHRQRGTIAYLQGSAPAAIADLQRAVGLNPSDDLGWRILALAHEANGQSEEAYAAATRSVTVQRSDVSNTLLLARTTATQGRPGGAAILAELVQSWPAALAAPGWADLLPPGVSNRDILDEAADRWLQGARTTEIPSDQGIWLGVLAGRPDVLSTAVQRYGNERLAQALVAVISCQGTASSMLADPTHAELRTHAYWQLRVRASAAEGDVDLDALQILQIMAGGPYRPPSPGATLNPLNENTGLSADRWGYRRQPIEWPEGPVSLPSVHAGAALWMFNPRAAAEVAGLTDLLPRCSS